MPDFFLRLIIRGFQPDIKQAKRQHKFCFQITNRLYCETVCYSLYQGLIIIVSFGGGGFLSFTVTAQDEIINDNNVTIAADLNADTNNLLFIFINF